VGAILLNQQKFAMWQRVSVPVLVSRSAPSPLSPEFEGALSSRSESASLGVEAWVLG